jgi:hypothetical protein
VIGPAVTGQMAREIAARLTARGYQVRFPPGRDVAMFQVTGLTGDPYVEVCAEDDGWTGCHYTGRTAAEAADVIARLPATALPGTDVATWDGVDIEWHFIPGGQPAGPDHVAGLLLAHLAVLDSGCHAVAATVRGRVTAGTGDA